MRPCTYTVTRHGPRRQRQSVSQSLNGDEDTMDPGMRTSSASDLHTSPATAAQHDDPHEIAQGPLNADLNDTMMATVVSNGNDALNLLFEAAQQEERGISGARVPVITDQHDDTTTSPLPSVTNLSSNSLPRLSSELTDTWNAYRFVRMGWLSAQEIVWYLDM
jgi:hypothetical protein